MQKVIRTSAFENLYELQKLLEDGYTVVMCNRRQFNKDGYGDQFEYILQKDDQQSKHVIHRHIARIGKRVR
ncbi:hypothetical protein [Anaerorhabdus sp.]|uniref:hypothetical protein n=1 Tax=Anaerorhabdus sp. TaxID=1872524 RepID=UPI002FC654B3